MNQELEESEWSMVDEYRVLLEEVYREFAKRKDAPECLRQLIYETIGRMLP